MLLGGLLLEVSLRRSFRYVHEPLRTDEDALPWLGNDLLGAELQSRLLHSRGGTFLITGFRGVGKSTMVLRTLDKMVAASPPGDVVLPVWLSVARSTTTERLLFAIVRRVFEALVDSQVLDRLPPDVRHALLVAYMRTSLSFKETQSEARERSTGLDMSFGSAHVANVVVPKLSMSSKRSQALATEAAFLAYSETDAEYDLMRIISLVGKESLAPSPARSWRHRLSRAFVRYIMARLQRVRGGRQPGRRAWAIGGVESPVDRHPSGLREKPRLRLVIVLDEVDKLTGEDVGLGAVEDLLSGAKNVLTTSGAHFLIVAGPDLHDRAVHDAARGSGVYESVFGWRMYIPCLWDAPETLVRDLVWFTSRSSVSFDQLEPFIRYLRFKARGVPRRLLQEFNSFVFWERGSPVLRITDAEMRRVQFYARLERIMTEYFQSAGQTRLFPVQIDEDRWRLGGYYVADWVLRSEGEPFSTADLFRTEVDSDFDPLLRISHRATARLLDHLVAHNILEVVRESDARHTIIGDVSEAGAKVYRLADDIRRTLFGLAIEHETERASLDLSIIATPSAAFSPDSGSVKMGAPGSGESHSSEFAMLEPPPIKVLGDRYELLRLLGQGGMGSVYVGLDRLTGEQVAVKMLRPSLTVDPNAMARIRREGAIARRVSHPHVVRTLDVTNDGPEGSPALIMELLQGPTLSQRVADQGPIRGPYAVKLGVELAEALGYLASLGIARIDLKPSNIIIHPRRGPVIIDLGVARDVRPDLGVARDVHSEWATDVRVIIGTPTYMAPELVRGEPADSRSDIYSLGIVLYFCLAGRTPWKQDSVESIMFAIVNRDINVSALPISEEFRSVIAQASNRDQNIRFRSADEMIESLTSTPEWRER